VTEATEDKKKPGRPATGWTKWRNGSDGEQWYTIVTLANGKRSPWIALAKTILRDDEPGAKAAAKAVAEERRAGGYVAPEVTETVEEFAKRWCKWRDERKIGCVAGDRAKLAAHVFPSIGSLDVRAVSRSDLKRLVESLDAKTKRGHTIDTRGKRPKRRPFGWKTAGNVWNVVRALFRDARSAKRDDLCVREDNPTEGVEGPDTGTTKAKTYLWPSEFLTLVSCARVPLRWRRLFALSVYLFVRAGELAALEWTDVDLEHRILHVHRSDDRVRRRGVTSTKSDAARRIPIEPTLVPLLTALHAAAKGKGHVFRLPSPGVLSRKLKGYLRRAGVTRADLFTSDATRKAITFHDLRATGITWCAVRGDAALKIMQRAGHADLSTTQIYVREAENLAAGFGAVFPELPPDLLDGGFRSDFADCETQNANSAELQVERGGADEDRIRPKPPVTPGPCRCRDPRAGLNRLRFAIPWPSVRDRP
jgi:integrase